MNSGRQVHKFYDLDRVVKMYESSVKYLSTIKSYNFTSRYNAKGYVKIIKIL